VWALAVEDRKLVQIEDVFLPEALEEDQNGRVIIQRVSPTRAGYLGYAYFTHL
jgi:hypothetical protein